MVENNEINVGQWVDDRLAALNPPGDWQPDETRGFARLRNLRDAQSVRAPSWTWVMIAAAVICIAVLALPATRVFAERCVSACVSFLHSPSIAAKSGHDRQVAPDFTLIDANGQAVQLSSFKGGVVLLNFWATWCNPCRVEIPWFVEFQRTYHDRGLTVLGISLDEDGWKPVKPYIARNKIDYRVMVGGDDLARRFGGVESLPTTLIIDRSGRIAATHVGLVSKADYEAGIKAVLAE